MRSRAGLLSLRVKSLVLNLAFDLHLHFEHFSFVQYPLNEALPPEALNQTTSYHVPAVDEDEEDEFEGE